MDEADKKLLQKFLNNTCNLEESGRVHELLAHPEAQKVLEELTKEEWNKPVDVSKRIDAKQDRSWTKFMSSLQDRDRSSVRSKRLIPSYLRYAAVFVGLIVLSSIAVWQMSSSWQTEFALIEVVNNHHFPERHILPDSSEIFLAAGGRLTYTQDFNTEMREVKLVGEAFFDVERDPAKPFIITTDDIQTRVLGTSFKVEALEGQPVIVSVATGKVGVSRHSDKKVDTLALLTPGQKITWDRKTLRATRGQVNVYGLEQWRAGSMVFDETPMLQVADELNKRYGIILEFVDSQVALYKINTILPPEIPVVEVMQVLALTGEFHYETSDNKTYKIYKTE